MPLLSDILNLPPIVTAQQAPTLQYAQGLKDARSLAPTEVTAPRPVNRLQAIEALLNKMPQPQPLYDVAPKKTGFSGALQSVGDFFTGDDEKRTFNKTADLASQAAGKEALLKGLMGPGSNTVGKVSVIPVNNELHKVTLAKDGVTVLKDWGKVPEAEGIGGGIQWAQDPNDPKREIAWFAHTGKPVLDSQSQQLFRDNKAQMRLLLQRFPFTKTEIPGYKFDKRTGQYLKGDQPISPDEYMGAYLDYVQEKGGVKYEASPQFKNRVASEESLTKPFTNAEGQEQPPLFDQLIEARRAIPDNAFRKFNVLTNSWEANTGNPDVARYVTLQKGIAEKVATILKQGGTPTDSALSMAEHMLDMNYSADQLEAAIKASRGELEANIHAMRAQGRKPKVDTSSDPLGIR